MPNDTTDRIARIESSFLFTKEEKDVLSILCGMSEYSSEILRILEESLGSHLEAEVGIAVSLRGPISNESKSVVREIELAERKKDVSEISAIHFV